MSQISGHNFDRFLCDTYLATDGFPKRMDIPLTAWMSNANGTLDSMPATGAGIWGWGKISTNLTGLVCDDTADQTKMIELPFTVPSDFRRPNNQTGDKSTLLLRVKARKRDTGANPDNADLALNLQAFWHNSLYNLEGGANQDEIDGDTAVSTLSAAISKVLNVPDVADGTEEKFRWYEFDITAAMSAAQRLALRPGASMTIQLFPNEAVGTGLTIDVLATEMWYLGHETLPRNVDRRKLRTA